MLISMFVLLFGLMGVAAIFPVGNYYVVEGEKFDLASGIAQNAFEELRARGMLKPALWMYGDSAIGAVKPVMQPNGTNSGDFANKFPPGTAVGPGHAFVIDPIGSANVTQSNAVNFPYISSSNFWQGGTPKLPGSRWPVQRITLPQAGNVPLTADVAKTIFQLRDDLSVDQPKQNDVPSKQLWDVDGTDLLRRQYKGNYTWLATVVPTTREGVDALQPSHEAYGEIACDVSVVVFRKRDEIPSGNSERFALGELLPGGELVVYDASGNGKNPAALDAVFDGIRSGTWIALMGVNRTSGDFVMKWYRILSVDDETQTEQNVNTITGSVALRRAMLIGPDWPTVPDSTFEGNIGIGIFPGVISVVTKPLRMESSSLWELE